jgi:ankyrin repeat protein
MNAVLLSSSCTLFLPSQCRNFHLILHRHPQQSEIIDNMSFDEMLAKVRETNRSSELSRNFISIAKSARNAHGDTLLHILAAEGSANAVNVLLEIGCDVNAQDDFGSTAIQSAAWREHRSIVEKLLEAGAKISIVDSTGFTSVQNLRLLGKDEMADWLCSWKGSDRAHG